MCHNKILLAILLFRNRQNLPIQSLSLRIFALFFKCYRQREQAFRHKKMLFAIDQDVGRYGDVRTFDYGPDPVVNAYSEMAQIIDLLPNNLVETFISAPL